MVGLRLPDLQAHNAPADDASFVAQEAYKWEYKDFHEKQRKHEENSSKIFSLVLGQCSRMVRDRIKASTKWMVINNSSDVIGLLTLIWQSMFTRATNKHATHALIEAEFELHKFRQGERMSNSTYLKKLKLLIEVYEHNGGKPGGGVSRVTEFLVGDEPNIKDPNQCAAAAAHAHEEYIAILLLTKSDPKRYGDLVSAMVNEYTRGQDGYPTTVSAAYDMLVGVISRKCEEKIIK
jgi:hypothetical protein